MTGRGNDIPDQSPRFILRKNDGPFLVQSPSSMSFVLIQGQQYVIPVSNQLVGSFGQNSPSVSQTNILVNQHRTPLENEEKNDPNDDLQELPPALDKVDDEEELDENRETPMGFTCEKAFLKEADEFKKSVNDKGVLLHHIHGFAIEESERPLSPMSVQIGKRKDKENKESSSQRLEESSKKEKRKTECSALSTSGACSGAMKLWSEPSQQSDSALSGLDKIKGKSKKCRGNELTQLLSMDFGPKAGERIILDSKRRSFNDKHEDENIMKRSFHRHRNFSEDSVSYNSSSKECSESDYPIQRISGKSQDAEIKKCIEHDLLKKHSLVLTVAGRFSESETELECITDSKLEQNKGNQQRDLLSKSCHPDNEIKSESIEQEGTLAVSDANDELKVLEDVNHECYAEYEAEKKVCQDVEDKHGHPIAESSSITDTFVNSEKLENFEEWEVHCSHEKDASHEREGNESTSGRDLSFRFEITSMKHQLYNKAINITTNQNKCLNCVTESCSDVYPQYCSVACRQMFIKENGDQYSYIDSAMYQEDEECCSRRNRTDEIMKHVVELNCDEEDAYDQETVFGVPCNYHFLNKHVKLEDEKLLNEKASANSVDSESTVPYDLKSVDMASSELLHHGISSKKNIQSTLEESMEKLIKIHPYNWSVEETCSWILSVTGSKELAETFEKEVIDASVLFSLSSKEMRESPFRMKFGFARKIEVAIEKCCDYWRIPNRLDNCEETFLTKDISSITVDDLYRLVFQRTKDKKLASRIKDEEIDGFILQITSWEELRATCVTEDLTKLGVKWKVDRVEHLFNSLKTKSGK